MEVNYYKVLEVEPTATQEEIKKAFRRLSKKHHPDKGGDAEKFKEINEAYQTLGDEDKRKRYDNPLQSNSFMRVADVTVRVSWKFDDVKNGRKFNIAYQRVEICSNCEGVGSKDKSAVTTCSRCKGGGLIETIVNTPFGQMSQGMTCPDCNGQGDKNTNPCPVCKGHKAINKPKTLDITIPPGTLGTHIIYGEGHKTPVGTSNLVLLFTLQEPGFMITGQGIVGEMSIPFFSALLGKDMPLNLGSTTLMVKIPKESHNGKVIKLTNAFCGYTVFITLRVLDTSLKEMKEFVLSLVKEQKDIPSAIARIGEAFENVAK